MSSIRNSANLSELLQELRADTSVLPVVVGPTASGKTALGLALAAALDGEIVSVDSVQVYRRFDVGSAKPTAAERAAAPHHLIDVADGKEPLDAGAFAPLADAAIAAIRGRGRRPILVGGTFLWVKSVLFGLADAPRGAPTVRAAIEALALAEGREAVWGALAAVDPAAAARLHKNDLVRTSRALEVFRTTGRPLSAFHAAHGGGSPRYAHRLLTPARTPEELDARIAARATEALASGFLEETRALLDDGYRGTRPMGSVGYREVVAHLDGALPREELAPAIVRATRVFVRRQRTWLRDEAVTAVEARS